MLTQLLPELFNLVVYFLGNRSYAYANYPSCVEEHCMELAQNYKDLEARHLKNLWGYPCHTKSTFVSEGLYKFLRSGFLELRRLAQVSKYMKSIVLWHPLASQCQVLQRTDQLHSHYVIYGGRKFNNDEWLENVTFSNRFYFLALLRLIGRRLDRAWCDMSSDERKLFAEMYQERAKLTEAKKATLRIQWSERERRPTKKPRLE